MSAPTGKIIRFIEIKNLRKEFRVFKRRQLILGIGRQFMQEDSTRMQSRRPGDAKRDDANTYILQWICRSVLKTAFPIFQNAQIDACFYPYIGLTHTIRRKGTKCVIRISDHCKNAPRPVIEAIAMILGSKIVRRRPPRKSLEDYEAFRKELSIIESVRERRRLKGRKHISGTAGKHYAPAEMFKDINGQFFNNQIEVQRIGWGQRKGWARLGHYDPVHHTITLSPVLDSPKVPEYVVRYIIYHEMLHVIFEELPSSGFRKHHPAEFGRAERAYPDYDRAKKFLREHFGKRRRSIDD
jgi:hypothetical protein